MQVINWKRKIEYVEYSSDSLFGEESNQELNMDIRKNKNAIVESNTIEISFFKLFVNVAKSILTRAHIYDKETAAFARSYFNIIPFMLGEKNGYLVIDYNRKDILRDFSKTTRIGEIAQGINYYLFRDKYDLRALYDFKYYLKRENSRACCSGKTPDYVLHYRDGSLGILESKGTVKPNSTELVLKGREQCINGCSLIYHANEKTVKNYYTSVVSFATSSPYIERNTCIYCVDPYNKFYTNGISEESDLLYEYSKWFYLAGAEKITNKLLRGEKLVPNDIKEMEKFGNGYIINSFVCGTSQKNIARITFGMCKSVVDYLISGDSSYISNIKGKYQINEEIFSDGTFIRVEKDR